MLKLSTLKLVYCGLKKLNRFSLSSLDCLRFTWGKTVQCTTHPSGIYWHMETRYKVTILNVEMADKLWNKWATAAHGHKKRLISCPWICCCCAAWAQHSSRLKCENNVGRCAFDLTEWHLPSYPWDWVVKHCKDLLLPHHWWKNQLTKAEWMNSWLLSEEWDLSEWRCTPNVLLLYLHLSSTGPSVLSSFLYSRSNHHLPPISLVCSILSPVSTLTSLSL